MPGINNDLFFSNRQILKETEAMAAQKQSLIVHDCKFLESVLPMNLQHLKELEDHILTSNCPHSSHLKDFTFDGNSAWPGTTPLLLACQQGELESVKHIVESWGVDLRASAAFYSNLSKQRQPTIQKATPLFIAALYGYDQIVLFNSTIRSCVRLAIEIRKTVISAASR